ncbi:hypothetical protein A2635_04915 [Candidatus Peribacteria bacterium RIFCSPHIGHO2_01_FULL_51_9]|nr:MAG: hypothetical protein A2635_04915 [Candidatus Peribacteria bacterium RIFCSPHIGHO2_01_FULL_51_9]
MLVNGSVEFLNNLTIGGLFITNGDTSIGGTLTVSGTTLMNSDLTVAGAIETTTLTVQENATVGGKLSASLLEVEHDSVVHGTLNVLGDILINGHPLSLTGGSLADAMDILDAIDINALLAKEAMVVLGDVTIEGLAIFKEDVQIEGELVVSSKQAGTATIPQGSSGVTIVFDPPWNAIPVIVASPSKPVLYAVNALSQTGFTIEIAEPAETDITFTWMIMGTLDGSTLHAQILAPEPSSNNESSLSTEDQQNELTADSSSIPFPVDSDGVPLSKSEIWNACIRNHVPLADDGTPYNCARYHEEERWEHPDLGITFTWNSNRDPVLLEVPDGYAITSVTEESTEMTSETEQTVGETPEETTSVIDENQIPETSSLEPSAQESATQENATSTTDENPVSDVPPVESSIQEQPQGEEEPSPPEDQTSSDTPEENLPNNTDTEALPVNEEISIE